MYKGKSFTRERVYVCGDYMDGDIYPVFQKPGERRKRCKPTGAIQARLNQRNAERRLTRLVHNNFSEKDIALHLTYAPGREPEGERQAERNLYNFLRRCKRRYKKLGLELKYITRTEHGGRGGRVHHHLILSGGMDRDELEQLWGRGYANSKRLQFGEDGVSGLARYMVKDRTSYRRWNRSHNLNIPEPAELDGRISMEELEVLTEDIEGGTAYKWFEERYPDFELVEVAWTRNSINRGAYVSFTMRRRLF